MDDFENNNQGNINENPSPENVQAGAEKPDIEPIDINQKPAEPEQTSYPYSRPAPQQPVNNNTYPYGQGAAPNMGYPYTPVQQTPPPVYQNSGVPYGAPHANGQNNGYYPNYQGAPQPPVAPPPQPKKSKTGRNLLIALICICLIISVIFAAKVANKRSNGSKAKENGDSVEVTLEDQQTDEKEKNSDGTLTATAVYEKVSDSSVGILVYRASNSFGSFAQSNLYGEGSGVIMGENSQGTATYIITCAHVVSDSGVTIKIQLNDGEQYDASIVGLDTKTDIAVLSTNKTGLKKAEFGDSSTLKVGQKVYAIGNPGGTEFFGSFTAGMISAIARPVSSPVGYEMSCIQHDAAINPGNSGGALVNENGQVIGINSSKIADENYEGMGFAVPSETVKEIVDDIIANGYVTNRAKLGISYGVVSQSQDYSMIVQLKGYPAGSIIIGAIQSDSSLANTKAQVGDLIIKVNGKDMDDSDLLFDLVQQGSVGDKLTLTLVHISSNYETEEFEVEATLVEDKGTVEEESTTQASYYNPFDFGN